MLAAALIISGIILIGFAGCALEALNRRNAQDDTERRLANAHDPHLAASARIPAYEFDVHPLHSAPIDREGRRNNV